MACAFFAANVALAQTKPGAKAAAPTHVKLLASQLQWQEAPPSMPPGAKIAFLDGDPAKAGPFTIRLLLPPNYQVMTHSHPGPEYLTIIEGEFFYGEGNTLDEKKAAGYPAGSFIIFPAKHQHYVFTKNKTTIVQIQSTGPWDLTYTDVANDPRKQKPSRPGAR